MLPDSLEIAILMYKSPQICILKTTAEEVTKASDDNTVRVKISRGCSMHRDSALNGSYTEFLYVLYTFKI